MFLNLCTVAVVSLLAAMSPGPDFFIVLKNSMSYSRRIGILTAIGICMALFVHLSYTMVGIGLLMSEGSLFYNLVKYCGATYLFYLGSKNFYYSFKKKEKKEVVIDTQSISAQAAFRQGFLTNLLNPKCALFFVSLFSQFVMEGTSFFVKIEYALINWTVSLFWFIALSYLVTTKALTTKIGQFQTIIDRLMGAALMLLSLKVLVS